MGITQSFFVLQTALADTLHGHASSGNNPMGLGEMIFLGLFLGGLVILLLIYFRNSSRVTVNAPKAEQVVAQYMKKSATDIAKTGKSQFATPTIEDLLKKSQSQQVRPPIAPVVVPPKSVPPTQGVEPVTQKSRDVPEAPPHRKPAEVLQPQPPVQSDVDAIIFTTLGIAGWVPQQEPWTYPMLRYPKVKTVIQRPREYHKALRGHTEAGFQSNIEQYFAPTFMISGNHALPTSASSRPYEPDISMISRKAGINIFLDIEIDEPYAAIKRNPMHCIGVDDMRDVFFNDRGWLVIRFTEKQIATAKNNCLAFIAKTIKRLDPTFNIPSTLLDLADPPQEGQWTALQAQKWEKDKYREGYLGITTFGNVQLPPNDVALELSVKEKEVESKVKPSVMHQGEGPSPFQTNITNSHPRDQRIQFIPSSHTYLIDGIKATSVTTLVESVFPIFDSEYHAARKSRTTGVSAATYVNDWAANGKRSADLGTQLHADIERHYHQGTRGKSPEFQKFLAFAAAHPLIKPYRSEWRIFDERSLVAGTIDLLSKNADNSFDMYDWKRSSKVIDAGSFTPILKDKWEKTGIGVFSSISDTSCNRYFLQQNVYRLILESNYDIKVKKMYLVVIHPELGSYHKVEVPIWTDHAKMLIESAY